MPAISTKVRIHDCVCMWVYVCAYKHFIRRAWLVELRVNLSRVGADSLPGFRWMMDVQGERGHYSFTGNTSLLTDPLSLSATDKLSLSWIMMTVLFLFFFFVRGSWHRKWTCDLLYLYDKPAKHTIRNSKSCFCMSFWYLSSSPLLKHTHTHLNMI